MITKKNIILLASVLLLIGCENMTSYEGVVIDAQTKQKISGAKVQVLMNGNVRKGYGVSISDTISRKDREIIIEKNNGDREGWSHHLNEEGKYIRYMPYLSDSNGIFGVYLHESCIFGCPEFEISFQAEGYNQKIIKGNWKGEEKLIVSLEK